MPSMHLATDRGMNDGLNGLLLGARLVSAASAMLEALKYADRGISMYHSAMKDDELLGDTLRSHSACARGGGG